MSLFNVAGALAGGYLKGEQLNQAKQLNEAHLQTLDLQNSLLKSRVQALQGLFNPSNDNAQAQGQPPQAQAQAQTQSQSGLPPAVSQPQTASLESTLSPQTNPLIGQANQLFSAASYLSSRGDLQDANAMFTQGSKLYETGLAANKELLAQHAATLDNGAKEASAVAQAATGGETPQAFQDSIKQLMFTGQISPQVGQRLLQTPWSPALMQRLKTLGTTRAQQLKEQHDQVVTQNTDAYRKLEISLRQQELNLRKQEVTQRIAQAAKKAKTVGPKALAVPSAQTVKMAGHTLSQLFGAPPETAWGNSAALVAETAQGLVRENPNMSMTQALSQAASQLKSSGAITINKEGAQVANQGDTEFNPEPLKVVGGKAQVPSNFKGERYFQLPAAATIGGKRFPAGQIIKVTGG